MKMGTIHSPWHYDVGAYITTRQLKMRRPTLPLYFNAAPQRQSRESPKAVQMCLFIIPQKSGLFAVGTSE